MIKVKKSKSVLIEDNGILIRSISNEDMDYYADWYTKQFAEGFLESMPKEKVDSMMSPEFQTTFLII